MHFLVYQIFHQAKEEFYAFCFWLILTVISSLIFVFYRVLTFGPKTCFGNLYGQNTPKKCRSQMHLFFQYENFKNN